MVVQGSRQSCMLLTLELTLIHPTHMLQGYVPYLHHVVLFGDYLLLYVQQNLCLYTSENVGVMSTGMVQIESGAEDHLQMAVALAGPVTVSIDSRHSAFQVRGSFRSVHSDSYNLYYSFTHLVSMINPTVPQRS